MILRQMDSRGQVAETVSMTVSQQFSWRNRLSPKKEFVAFFAPICPRFYFAGYVPQALAQTRCERMGNPPLRDVMSYH